MKLKDGKEDEIIEKHGELTGELRAQGLKVEKYIIKRSYRGNAFDLIDMIGFDTYPFFIKY